MAKKIVNLETKAVTFDFTKDGGDAVVVGLGDLSEDIITRLALHGLSQKVGDSYANAKNQADPLKWAQEQVQSVIKGLKEGVFNIGRTGEGTTRVSMLARAIHRIKVAAGEESTEVQAQEAIDAMTKEQVAELKSKKRIKKELDKIRLEDAAKALERAQAKAAAGGDEDEDDEE